MIAEGRSINVTLIFSLERYREVIEAYLSGLEKLRRAAEVTPPRSPRWRRSSSAGSTPRPTAASSRSPRTTRTPPPATAALELRGTAAVAQARLAYGVYLELFAGPRWQALAARRRPAQRPLWASTSTKNPAYPDLAYVDTLVAPEHRQHDAGGDARALPRPRHGRCRSARPTSPAAEATFERLAECGIDIADVAAVLESEGVAAFAASFDDLLGKLQEKADAARRTAVDLRAAATRLEARDHTLVAEGNVAASRLGWLDTPRRMLDQARTLRSFAASIDQDTIVLLGMGGSSLGPAVLAAVRDELGGGAEPGRRVVVCDTTDPSTVAALPLEDAFIVVSSKSGTTLEPNVLFSYARSRVGDPRRYAVVTDPGTPLQVQAGELGIRHVFENQPDIGGRYSVLSYFGLVPAALMGYDVGRAVRTRPRRRPGGGGLARRRDGPGRPGGT